MFANSKFLVPFPNSFSASLDKANRLEVGNAVNPCPSEKDNKLVVAKTPNAVNPLLWDYSVSLRNTAVCLFYFPASVVLSAAF